MRFVKALLSFFGISIVLLILVLSGLVYLMIAMPGESFRGIPPELTAFESESKEHLFKNLERLSVEIGERNSRKLDKLNEAAQFIESKFNEYGYEAESQYYSIDNTEFRNLEATITGTKKAEEIIVVGAHYDTVPDCPGADDNGTGVVSVLELARLLKDTKLDRTVKLVAFTNEEYPFFWSENMGSQVYAKRAFEKNEKIVGMIAIETIGYYSSESQSQYYPVNTLGVFPDRGNFVFFVGNLSSRQFLCDSIGAFRSKTKVPSCGIAALDVFEDIARSDNKSFWDRGYPGFMITDTANFRNPNYHRSTDTMDKLDFDNLARVVRGLERTVLHLANH